MTEPARGVPDSDGGSSRTGSGRRRPFDPVELDRARLQTPRRPAGLLPLLRDSVQLTARADRAGLLLTVGVTVLGAVLAGLQVLAARSAIGAFVDVSDGAADMAAALLPLVLLIVVILVATSLSSVNAQRVRVLGQEVYVAVWRRVFAVTTRLDLETYESEAFYDDLERVRNNALERPLQMVQGIVSLVGGVVGSLSIAVGLAVIAPLLLPVLLLGIVPVYVLQRRGGRAEFAFNLALTPLLRVQHYLVELLTGRPEAKDVRAFGLAATMRRRYDDVSARYTQALRRHVRRRMGYNALGMVVTGLIGIADLALLLFLVDQGQVDVAEASAAAIAVALLGSRLALVASGIGALYESALFLEDLDAFLRREVGVEATPEVADRFRPLHLRDVTFRYPAGDGARPALQAVDLDVRAGEVVALVGANGSGKTTLAKLVAGLYAPTSGRILDADTGDPLRREELRRQVACLFQDFTHFDLSARDNVGLGAPDRADDEAAVREAARRAGADDFLGALPDGYDTLLSVRFGGHDLSGGQWQRVALARAVMRGAPFIVLDEPTSALDPAAEAALFDRLREVMAGRAVLMVSHRFSTVRNADRIYVMDEGRIVEHGSHEELMARNGQYAGMFRLQAAAYVDGPAG